MIYFYDLVKLNPGLNPAIICKNSVKKQEWIPLGYVPPAYQYWRGKRGGVLCDLVPENVGDRGFSCDLVLFVEGGMETGRGGYVVVVYID